MALEFARFMVVLFMHRQPQTAFACRSRCQQFSWACLRSARASSLCGQEFNLQANSFLIFFLVRLHLLVAEFVELPATSAVISSREEHLLRRISRFCWECFHYQLVVSIMACDGRSFAQVQSDLCYMICFVDDFAV